MNTIFRKSVTQSLHQGNKEVIPAYDLLREQLNEANEARQRADTIIMQLTKQVEQQTLALEDKSRIIDEMQNRSWWRPGGVKMTLGFSGT